MIRRIRRTMLLASPLPLAALGAAASLLLLSLPAQADDIEPEPYVEEETEAPEPEPVVEAAVEEEPEAQEEPEAEAPEEPSRNIAKFVDLVIVRPLYVARLVVGMPFFVFYPFTIGSGYDEDVLALLWTEPFEATFKRPLGETPGDY